MIRGLICFGSPTSTYTAHVDESVLHVCFDTHQIFWLYMCCTCYVRTASDSRIKMLFFADFNIYRFSRRTCVTSVLKLNRLLIMCCTCFVSTSSDSRIFLKCFDRPTLTYTAQVDESVLHLFDTHQILEYMCWTCFVWTPSDSRIKMLCYADFNIHRSSRRKSVTYLYWNSTGYWLCVVLTL